MDIKQIVQKVESLPNCTIFKPEGIPQITKHKLPSDLLEFYTLCGGMVLFENDHYSIHIVGPDEFSLANPVIIGELVEGDISSDWYIIANDGNDEFLTIDLNEKRVGRCYDSYSDRHGIVGETQVIATSFSDLLERLIENEGKYWYWLKNDFKSIGDAYDSID